MLEADKLPPTTQLGWYAARVKEELGKWRLGRDLADLSLDCSNGAAPTEIAQRLKVLELRLSDSFSPERLERLDVQRMLVKGGWEPHFALEDFLIDRTFTWLSGPAKGFKTWLALHWAVALAMGRQFLRLTVEGEHRVLVIQAENRVQILQRLPRVCTAFDVPLRAVLERVFFYCPRTPLRLESPADASELRTLAASLNATWVFIDSFRRITAHDENDPVAMAELADRAFLPIRDDGRGILVLEHPSKPTAGLIRNRRESLRGSGEKLAACDVQLFVESHETEGGRIGELSVSASRMGPERDEPIFLQLRDTPAGGVEFEEVEEPANRARRKTPGLDQAINCIRAERGRNPGIGFSDAIRVCKAAGLSRATAVRAWKINGGTEV